LLEERRLGRELHTQGDPGKTVTRVPLQATVTSAVRLTRGELKALLESLQQKYKRPINAEVSVKDGFSGGVRVEVGGDVWIASYRAECVSLKPSSLHADEDSSLIARLFGRDGNEADANLAALKSRFEPERSMQLGKAIVVPPIPAPESYEGLQSNLWVRYRATSTKVTLLVGADSGCGVSTVAANLAASLAKNSCARILLIDANVRSGKQGTRVPLGSASEDTGVSLSRLLTDAPVLRDPPAGPSNLYVLPSGGPCALSLAAFQSVPLEELFRKAREFFEHVIIDVPSLSQHSESLLLMRRADGVILVVESEKTRKQSAFWAKRQIEKTGVPLLGVILNRRKYRVPGWLYKRI
jgi:Mrp family chromosome partitioning ATPase